MENITISLIIAIYNEESHLRQFLNSVINQTYHQLEIIIVDDGSSDKSGIIADEYAQKDKRVVVIHQPKKGVAVARNAGIDIAKGDYFMFADADDILEPTFCEKPLKIALEKKVQLVVFGYTKTNVRGKTRVIKTLNPRTITSSEAIRTLITLEDVIHGFVWNKIYQRSLFDKVRFPNKRNFSDQGVNYLLFYHAKEIYLYDEILYHYQRRNGSLSFSYYRPYSIQNRFEIWLDRLAFIQKKYPELEQYQLQQLVNESFLAYAYTSSLPQFKPFMRKVEDFLITNKKGILQLKENNKRKLLIFYYCRPFFRFYYNYYCKKYWNKESTKEEGNKLRHI